jgi:hypothetical protein
VVRDIDTAAKPNALEAAHVLEQPDEARAASRPSDKPIMQPYGQKLGGGEPRRPRDRGHRGISHVVKNAREEAAIFIEAVIVYFSEWE